MLQLVGLKARGTRTIRTTELSKNVDSFIRKLCLFVSDALHVIRIVHTDVPPPALTTAASTYAFVAA